MKRKDKPEFDIDKLSKEELITYFKQNIAFVDIDKLKTVAKEAVKKSVEETHKISTSWAFFNNRNRELFDLSKGHMFNSIRFYDFLDWNFTSDKTPASDKQAQYDAFMCWKEFTELRVNDGFSMTAPGRFTYSANYYNDLCDALIGLITGTWHVFSRKAANEAAESIQKTFDGKLTLTIGEQKLILKAYQNGRLDIQGLTPEQEQRIAEALKDRRLYLPEPVMQEYYPFPVEFPDWKDTKVIGHKFTQH